VVIIFNNNIMEQMATLLKFERFSSLWLNKRAKCQAHNAKGEFEVHISHTNKDLRLFLAFTINIVGLAIVTTTIPVFLCTSETYIAFVLNAAATLFIVELDDLKVDTKMVISGFMSPPPTSPITVADIADVVAATEDACTDVADVEAADYHFSQSASEEDGGGGEEEDGAGGGEEEDDQV